MTMFLFLCSGNFQSKAQTVFLMDSVNSYCYTKSNYPNFLDGNSTLSPFLMGGSNPTYVRLYIHILRKDDGTGGRTIEDVLDGLDYLYDAFSPHNIFFRIECIDYIDDWYLYYCGFRGCVSTTGDCAPYCVFDDYPLNDDGIDIFVQSNESSPYFVTGGVASGIPGSALVLGGTWPILDEVTGNTISLDVLKSHIFSHEMGHCLGLFHTHHGTIVEGGGDPGCPEIVNQPTDPGDPYYENCLNCGDYVCDTEAAAGIFMTNPNCVTLTGVFVWPSSVSGTLDILGTPFPYTQLNNIMSYVEPICPDEITVGQGNRCMEHLMTDPLLTPMVIDPLVVGNFNVIIDETISGQITWNDPTQVSGRITIPSGSELIIENTTVGFIGRNSGIDVEEGGILRIIDNSVLRLWPCDFMPDYWRGILIAGNTNKAHPTDYYTNGSPDHGVVIVENSSILEAQTALHAYDLFDVPGSTMGGGIVYAINSWFINNRVSIQLDRFRGEAGGPKYYQKSVIEENTFNNDDASWFHLEQYPFTHIALNAAGPGLTIRENNFIALNTMPVEDKGTGIRTVNTHLNILYNTFRNILHGIDAYNLPSITRSLTITGNNFNTTHRCISISGGVLATIAENSFFDIQAGTQDLNGYGIFSDGVWGYDISTNTFTCTNGDNTNDYNLGIIARNGTNQFSTITDNHFSGSFGIANYFEGLNSRLIVDCNVYDGNINNDWVINGFLNDQGACVTSNTLLARRNTFHTPITGINGFNIDATDYVHPTLPTYLFQYVGQPGFNPNSVTGNIQVIDDCFIDPVPFENSQCSLDPDEVGDYSPEYWRALLEQASDETQAAYLQTRLLRAQLIAGREEEAKEDLRTYNTTESAKLLAATYESEQKPDSAWLYLQQIPDDNAENSAFKELYTQLLQGIQPPAGSGKAMSAQELYLHQTALQEQTTYAPIAQTINAGYFGEVYYKNVKPAATRQIINAFEEQPLLSVYPNPAKNYVHFVMPADEKQYRIIITNMYGKQVAVHLLVNGKLAWNTDNISSGMYFCALVKQNGEVAETHKLVIAH